LVNFFINNGVDKKKIIYSPYGFYKDKIRRVKKTYRTEDEITFGYIGRIIPAKGVHILLEAFIDSRVSNKLLVFGSVGSELMYLKKLSKSRDNIKFMGGYDNDNICSILEKIDVLIVPSIWPENSPLVIQEAFLSGIPVITSDFGGMRELVTDRKNGFLFPIGRKSILAGLIRKIALNPPILNSLKVSSEDIRSIDEDVNKCYSLYIKCMEKCSESEVI
jgi:glycosyltransferase involved in cell wall biosynthesis